MIETAGSPASEGGAPAPLRKRWPLGAQVVCAVVLGTVLGVTAGSEPFLPGVGTGELGRLGILVIRLLKALAVPLVLFAILEAFVHTRIEARSGARLVAICLVNVSVAMTIGLMIMNVLRPGDAWQGRIQEMLAAVGAGHVSRPEVRPTLNPLENIAGYVPESLVDPFIRNTVISVVLLGVFGGAALRTLLDEGGSPGVRAVAELVSGTYQLVLRMITWVIHLVPFAVFGVVAQVVGKTGFGVFASLALFLVTLLAGLGAHSLLYYPFAAWAFAGVSPRRYLGLGADAILTGISINSSLATVPVTLRCLTEKLGISHASSRLAACVGTNLNNDGITLYEAMAALFLAQALGMSLGIGQQLVVVLAAIMAGIGVAGIPEAGLVVLPLVLSAAGLPEEVVVAAIPLIIPVDWIIARARSGVNVMSDMLVAILLDGRGAGDSPEGGEPPGAKSAGGLVAG